MELLGYALAAVIGLSLGLVGGGGSILTVPVFVYALGFPAKPAIAMSLPIVGTTSLVGALRHWRAGNVDLRVAPLFGAIAMVGAYVGARLAVMLSGAVQLLLLAIVMLVAAASMLRSGGLASVERRRGVETSPHRAPLWLLLAVGLCVGLLTGLLGIGGGFLIVPALVLLAGVPIKQAVGTSLVVIAMNAASGSLGYLGRVAIPWGVVAAFTVVAIAGIFAGTALCHRTSPAVLRRTFGVFLLIVGGLMLYENRGVLVPKRETAASAMIAPRR
jgi:uncharacterized protein